MSLLMHTLHVDLGERSYPVYIGRDLLSDPELLSQHIPGSQVVIVSNETIAPLYLDRLRSAIGERALVTEVILPDGEQYKTMDSLGEILDRVMTDRHSRTTTMVALGGGVVGDITGFAAACYQRGVNFVQVPTTLLAQVDSSVGGKTAVNHPLGKNMIGAFHQPGCVIIDTDTLDTLDDRQLAAGLAEVIKYGLIRDSKFYDWLDDNIERLKARDKAALSHAIERSCALKAEIVAADERESGQRALLNLGHTFGHAIETGTGYGNWLHGEAVATGMLMAADLSARHHWLPVTDVRRLESLLRRASLPTSPPDSMDEQQFLQLMAVDKKVMDGGLRLVLLKGIGKAVVTGDFDPALLSQTLVGAA